MIDILVTALISALIQLVEHWFPWRMVLRSGLPRLPSYILGVLGFLLPISALYWHWGASLMRWSHLLALWACVSASGLAAGLAYGIDHLADRVRRSYEHEELDHAKAASDGQ